MATPIRHLYFHIPFCQKLCPYCCFYVEIGARNKTRQFLDALLCEVELAQQTYELQPHTIYFGGGTPSALTVEQLDYLLGELRTRLDLSALREWTFETNPATVQIEKAELLRAAGVTRVSLGVQSWDDGLLKTLGRNHRSAQAEKTFHTLREADFENINIDLMFGIPGQTLAQWQATLAHTISLNPKHISAYCLTYEEDTEYFRQLRLGAFVQNDDQDAAFFETTMDTLSSSGFGHYEISNYARGGFESEHNLAYWRGHDYLGFGPSAFSTVSLIRWQSLPDTAEYTRRISAGESVIHFMEHLSESTRAGEIMAFAVRMREGVAAGDLSPWSEAVNQFQALGLITPYKDRYVLTRRGKLMADSVAEAFV